MVTQVSRYIPSAETDRIASFQGWYFKIKSATLHLPLTLGKERERERERER